MLFTWEAVTGLTTHRCLKKNKSCRPATFSGANAQRERKGCRGGLGRWLREARWLQAASHQGAGPVVERHSQTIHLESDLKANFEFFVNVFIYELIDVPG